MRGVEELRSSQRANLRLEPEPPLRQAVRVAVRADHAMLRLGVESMLDARGDVVSVADDVGGDNADVVVLIPCPGERLSPSPVSDIPPSKCVLVIAPDEAATALADGVRAGVYGFVSVDTCAEELGAAVRAVSQGAFYVSSTLAGDLCGQLSPGRSAPVADRTEMGAEWRPLTERETVTLRLVAQGLTHSQVARRLSLTQTTVDTYVKRIRAKLGVGNKADLTRKAIALGLVCTDSSAATRSTPPDIGRLLPSA